VAAISTYDSATYDVAVYDYPVGYAVVELYINGAWVDVTGYVRIADGIQIRRGRQDWSAQPTYATCDLTLDNRDGRFTPRNASGAYYPYLVRNTPLRVSVANDSGALLVRFWGDVSEWPVAVIASGADLVTRVSASGVRRRLNRAAVLQSPYRIAAGALTTLAAYWPLEDGSATTLFGGVTPNAYPMTVLGPTVTPSASADFSAAALNVPTLVGDKAGVAGNVRGYTLPAGGQQVRMLLECDTSTAGEGVDIVVTLGNGDYIVAEYVPVANTLQIVYRNADGTTVGSVGPSSLASAQPWTNPTRVSIESQQNGTGVDFGCAWLNTGQSSGFSLSANAPSTTLTRVSAVKVINGGVGVTTVLGHVTVESGKTSIFDLVTVLTGYAGETAANRAARIGAITGVPITITTAARGIISEAMGPQSESTALALFDECAYVDGGISYEAVDTRGLVFRPRSTLYSEDIGLVPAVTKIDGLESTDDDQTIENDVTANRVNGGSANYMVTTGNLAVVTIGDYPASYDLNAYVDDQLPYQAQWRAAVGTVDEPRRPLIGLDAMRLSAFDKGVLFGLREGDRLTVTDVSSSYAPSSGSQIDTLILGWTEVITDTAWHFSFNTRPATPYLGVLILDNGSYGFLDTNRLGL
jgi:hypothetical protein